MKRIVLYLSCIILTIVLCACDMGNTPTKRVEEFLNKYKSLDSVVINQMENMISTDTMMHDDQIDTYKDVLKRQYQDLTYTVKDEVIDGDEATVTVEIEVYDYYKANNDAAKYYSENEKEFYGEDNKVDESKYVQYRIDQMKKTTDRVKYSIDFKLIKAEDKWVLQDIDDVTRLKIHGLYEY